MSVVSLAVATRAPYASSRDHLHDELARIQMLVRGQVARWRVSAAAAAAERDWGMVIVTHAEIDRYLGAPISAPASLSGAVIEAAGPWWDAAAAKRREIDAFVGAGLPPGTTVGDATRSDLRLARLADTFALSPPEVDVLLLALLPELDDRFRRVFAYLQNDASDRVLRADLAWQVLEPALPEDAAARRDLLSPTRPLVANRLIVIGSDGDLSAPLGVHTLRIDDRIASFIVGSDTIDARLAGIAEIAPPRDTPIHVRPETAHTIDTLPAAIASALGDGGGVRLLLTGPDPALASTIAQDVCRRLRVPLLAFDAAAGVERDPARWRLLVDLVFREARLLDAAILCRHVDALHVAEQDRWRWSYLETQACAFDGVTFVEFDTSAVSASAVQDASFWHIDVPMPDFDTRERIWISCLPDGDASARLAADLAQTFHMTATQVRDAVASAANAARRDRAPITGRALFDACRRQTGKRLVSCARRIEPRPSLTIDDVVLPPPNRKQLADLRNRIRHHRELFHRSGLEHTMRIGKGLLALFAGASGTGKTLAAEALAAEMRSSGRAGGAIDLCLVDLSAIVSKWIGETEKNLARIFAEAERSNCWLFFDEGESLFGARADTKGGTAQDRLLNLEVSVLLQSVESFSGVVILATNLRQNIDPAFLRRIHAVVEFPPPTVDSRAAIWRRLIPPAQPRDFGDEDLVALAARFDLAGGNIRNVILDAMFRAYADDTRMLTRRHIAAGLAREYQKLGRPITVADFGDEFYRWIVEDILDPRVDGDPVS